MKVGETIRRIRVERNLSQLDLAACIGVSYAQLQKYEGGRNRVSASRLVQIANVLGADVSAFFEGTQPLSIDPTNDNFMPKVLMTRQGLELLRAFHAIQDSEIKAKLLM
eukprot:gene45349-biopygen31286